MSVTTQTTQDKPASTQAQRAGNVSRGIQITMKRSYLSSNAIFWSEIWYREAIGSRRISLSFQQREIKKLDYISYTGSIYLNIEGKETWRTENVIRNLQSRGGARPPRTQAIYPCRQGQHNCL